MFKEKYSNPLSPFRSFIYYNQSDCYYFIDWLEIYHHTYMKFNNINRYVFTHFHI
jgi:hypothetical protein